MSSCATGNHFMRTITDMDTGIPTWALHALLRRLQVLRRPHHPAHTMSVADLDDLDPCELAGIPSAIEAHITAVRQAWPEGYPSEVEQGE